MFENVKDVELISVTAQRFGPGLYGSFLYSTCTTIDLKMTGSVLKCYDNAFNYNTQIKPSLESQYPTGSTNSAIYLHNSIVGFVSTSNTFANCYISRDSGILNLQNTLFTDTQSTF